MATGIFLAVLTLIVLFVIAISLGRKPKDAYRNRYSQHRAAGWRSRRYYGGGKDDYE